jgi:cytochrome P450
MNWLLFNLANNPDKQHKLREELDSTLGGGDFNKDVKLPYLRSCYRESHRLTPAGSTVTRILPDKDIVLNDYLIPAGTKLTLYHHAIQNDPELVDNPHLYEPERWLSDSVEKRRGTEKEVIDSKIISTPFSFGSRMCLGSRLAENEILAVVARIVQDYEFVVRPGSPEIKSQMFTFNVPSTSPSLVCVKRGTKTASVA